MERTPIMNVILRQIVERARVEYTTPFESIADGVLVDMGFTRNEIDDIFSSCDMLVNPLFDLSSYIVHRFCADAGLTRYEDDILGYDMMHDRFTWAEMVDGFTSCAVLVLDIDCESGGLSQGAMLTIGKLIRNAIDL